MAHSPTDWSRDPVTRWRSLSQATPNTQSMWPCSRGQAAGRSSGWHVRQGKATQAMRGKANSSHMCWSHAMMHG